MPPDAADLLPAEAIQQRILIIRGKRVLLDADLARFYGVGTRELNRAVTRNPDRFPEDFAFKLTLAETQALMFQLGTSNRDAGQRVPSPATPLRPPLLRYSRLAETTTSVSHRSWSAEGNLRPEDRAQDAWRNHPAGRAKLRAEVDARIARLYALTEPEFAHILSTISLVPDATKHAALAEFGAFTH